MVINTKNFGYVIIPEEEIITLPRGLFAFEDIKEYVILGKKNSDNPFMWFQAVHHPEVCFVVIDPLTFKKDYSPSIDQRILETLEVEDRADIRFLAIVVIPADTSKMTANLRAPIVINAKKNIAIQVILDEEEYKIKHYILEEIQKGA